ncbi:MAG: T9SS type A sorting domain-containing protein [Crocinitomicaceae bacterium]
MSRLKFTLIGFFLAFTAFGFSQTGQVDTTFNILDDGSYLSNFNGDVKAVEALPSGDYFAAGFFTEYNGSPANRFVRLNNDGTIDNSFDVGAGPNGGVNGFTELENGNIIVFGEFNDFNGVPTDSVVRLFPDGSVDVSFQLNTGSMKQITDVVELSNGDLIISGGIVLFGSIEYTIIRTSPDGVINTSFAFQPVFGSLKKLYLDALEDVYILGGFYQIAGYNKTHLAKMDTSGVVYGAYTVDPYASVVNDMIVESNGSIVVCGSGGTSGGFFKALPNGMLDVSFNFPPGGGGTYSRVVKDSLGQYYFLWNGGAGDGTVYQTNSNGTINDDYYYTSSDQIQQFDACIDPSGKLIVARADGMRRYLTNGSLDPNFNFQNGANDDVHIVRTLPSGKTIIAGKFTAYNGVSRLGMARLMPDGQLDITFDPGVTLFNSVMNGAAIRDVEIQNDGKILVGGSFNSYSVATQKHLLRLNADGSLDTTFVIGNGLSGPVNEIIIRPDQKILVGGEFLYYDQFGPNQQFMRSVGVLEPNGTPDATTMFGTYQCSFVKTMELLPNGQLLLGGQLSVYNFQPVSEIIRLNTDASLDATFDVGTGVDYLVSDLELQSSGNIIVSGWFNDFNGTTVDQVFRILPNGTLDPTFYSVDVFTSSSVNRIEVLEDDKILAIGVITGGTGANQVVRLFDSGEIDTTFYFTNSAFSTNQDVMDMAISASNQIVIGGSFKEYNDKNRIRVTRLINDTLPVPCAFFSGEINSVSNLNCSDSSIISVTAVNGTPPYLYSWDNAAYSQNDTVFTSNQPGIHQISFKDSLGCVFDVDYMINGPVTQVGFDVDAQIVASQFRPGYSNVLVIDAFNDGCLSVDGELILILDSNLLYDWSIPIPDVISGDTLIWNYTDLGYDSTHLIPLIQYTTPATAQIGDSMHLITQITPIIGDVDTLNNIRHYVFPVVNGYDPNDKKVYPIGECLPHYIDQGEALTYTVRFQNTGNSEAINVTIADSLPSGMDLLSLRVLASSHTMHTEVYADNQVKFVFSNINLPDSASNPNGSIGYVIYELEQDGYLYPNTEIRNKAEIYFDFNPAIVTNEVFNTVFEDYQFNQETVTLDECDSLLWNGAYYSSTGVYSHVNQNVYGCDSIKLLNLVINESTSSMITQNGLDSVIVNNETYYSSGTYEQTFVNSSGCDSVVTINVTLEYSGIDEFENVSFLLYPNPTKEKLRFEFGELMNDIEVNVISQDGRVIQKHLFYETNSEIIKIDGAPGIYFVRFLLNKEVSLVVRIVKE